MTPTECAREKTVVCPLCCAVTLQGDPQAGTEYHLCVSCLTGEPPSAEQILQMPAGIRTAMTAEWLGWNGGR